MLAQNKTLRDVHVGCQRGMPGETVTRAILGLLGPRKPLVAYRVRSACHEKKLRHGVRP